MQVSKLLVSNLTITEDEYNFRGAFTLSDGCKELSINISDMEDSAKLENLKAFFELEEELNEMRSLLMNVIVEKASISSRIKEGESYQENSGEAEKKINCLDLA